MPPQLPQRSFAKDSAHDRAQLEPEFPADKIAHHSLAQPDEPQFVPDRTTNSALYLWMLGIALMATCLSGGIQLWIARTEPAPIVLHPPPTPAPTTTPLPTPTPAPFKVFVSGAVPHPGIYEVAADARVADALTLAGGLLAEADAALVNQAEHLWDGAQVHVPLTVEDVVAVEPPAGVSGEPASSQAGLLLSQSVGGKININTATVTELTTLSGIGESKANAIIAGRPYQSVDDLSRADGIGEKTVEKLREFVTVD